jgi:hypothetical protein
VHTLQAQLQYAALDAWAAREVLIALHQLAAAQPASSSSHGVGNPPSSSSSSRNNSFLNSNKHTSPHNDNHHNSTNSTHSTSLQNSSQCSSLDNNGNNNHSCNSRGFQDFVSVFADRFKLKQVQQAVQLAVQQGKQGVHAQLLHLLDKQPRGVGMCNKNGLLSTGEAGAICFYYGAVSAY